MEQTVKTKEFISTISNDEDKKFLTNGQVMAINDLKSMFEEDEAEKNQSRYQVSQARQTLDIYQSLGRIRSNTSYKVNSGLYTTHRYDKVNSVSSQIIQGGISESSALATIGIDKTILSSNNILTLVLAKINELENNLKGVGISLDDRNNY